MPIGPAFQISALAQRQAKEASIPFWGSGVAGPETFPSDASEPRIINLTYATHPWDTVYMAGAQLPGICKIGNGLTEIGIDMKKPDGKDGSTITVKGYKPGKFEVSCTTWTEEQWSVLQGIIRGVWRVPEKKAKIASIAFDIHHPALDLLGVTSCVVEGITYPQPGEFEGAKVVVFKCIQNVPAGKKKHTQTVSKVTVTPQLQSGINDVMTPVNAIPPKPSTRKSTTGPKGPSTPPTNGPT